MIVAAYAFRYEPDWLIEELRENLSWVDGFAALDTRGHKDVWVPRKERVEGMQALGREMGATWMLHLDPDERLQDGAEETLRKLSRGSHPRYSLKMCELWTPDKYRADGKWGMKWRRRFYRLDVGGKHEARKVPRVSIYHLATIEPENRVMRRDIHSDHNYWDNRVGKFDYLADERGLRLEKIPKGREYTPPYRKYVKQVPGY